MAEKNALIAQAVAARAALDADEEQSRRAINERLVGKCFVYRNCYSCPKTDADYWWLYIRIIRLDEDGDLYATEFQIDAHGSLALAA